MKKFTILFNSVFTLVLFNAVVSTCFAEEKGLENKTAPAQLLSADELLKQVASGIVSDRNEIDKLVDSFSKDKQNQANLLRQAEQQRNQLESKSKQLEGVFNKNKAELTDLLKNLNQRLGSLKELFGVFVQVSGDAQGQFQNSITQVQFGERTVFLREFNSRISKGNRLPSIEDVEKLWFELHREMTESGKIVTFKSKVVQVNGSEEELEVMRVGLFNLVGDGEYLRYISENGKIAMLNRQPGEAKLDYAEDVAEDSNEEIQPISIDPTRGQLIAALMETPSFIDQIKMGGTVGYFIMSLLVIAIIITIVRARVLNDIYRSIQSQLKSVDTPRNDNPLGRMLMVYKENKSLDPESLELKLDEILVKEIPGLQKGMGYIKLSTVVAPLAGLLGTVAGMILTFQAITLYGSGDPKLMATGISQALVNTIQGLATAIPGMFMSAYLTNRVGMISQILEEQTAGIIARQAEKS
ncbi:MAG: MotA/TolQ/ExbB proton channel family protein [Methylacidiphilales bacterium]|nr:MotA/TolQ/ExbB proton channel family protein [Candidatus Methylacidiphilales bacterium]